MRKVDGLEAIGRIPFARHTVSLIQRKQLTVYEEQHPELGRFLFAQPSQSPLIAFCLREDDNGMFSVTLADGLKILPGVTLLCPDHLILHMERDRLQRLQESLAEAIGRGMIHHGIRALVVGDLRVRQILKNVRCEESLESLRKLIPGAAAMATLEARYKPQGY